MKKLLIAIAGLCVATSSLHAAASGSCESKAASIKPGFGKAVTLVNEWDSEFGEYYDSGAYYAAATLTPGKSYTVWVESEDVMIDAYPRPETDSELDRDVYAPTAMFDSADYDGVQVMYLYGSEYGEDSSWEAGDTSWKYFFYLSGDIGQSVNLHFIEGIQQFVEPGTEENPKGLQIATTEKTESAAFIDGDFYFKATMTAGRKYLFRTAGGVEGQPVTFAIISGDARVEDDRGYASDTNNAAVVVYPQVTGPFVFTVSGSVPSFSLAYKQVAARPIASHPTKDLAVGGSAAFVPGPMNESNAWFDEIVDGNLYKISLAKNSRYIFETAGSTVGLKMYLYDSRGVVLAENTTKGGGSRDVRIGYAPAAAGVYYVGVCDPSLDIGQAGTGGLTSLLARQVAAEDIGTDRAVALSPIPATAADNPTRVGSKAEGVHRFSETVWSECFQIGGRKGISYALATAYAGAVGDLSLQAEIFTLSGKAERKIDTKVASYDITPGADPVTFTATQNATYYVRISVSAGRGLETPAYDLYSTAFSTSGDELGILKVLTKGAAGQWSVGKESVKYAGGVSILAAGEQTITFTRVTGFSQPAKQTVRVNPGTTPTVVTGIYSDTFDPKDDTPAGAARLNISARKTPAERTLYIEDTADHFVFTAREGVYYNFELENAVGDPLITVFRKGNEGAILAGPATSVRELAPGKGDFIVRVGHSAAPVDSSYTLVSDSANVGAIKFSRASLQAQVDTGYVDVQVMRTAREGAVRAEFATCAGTAKPGTDYYPTTNVLSWAAGDSSAKTVRVRLIPDALGQRGSKDGLTFSVKLRPYSGARAEGEYLAAISTAEAVVTMRGPNRISAPRVVKAATVKTETVPLRSGTFFGVATSATAVRGMASLASVTVTVSAKKPDDPTGDTVSAKVMVAGKTYQFKTARDEMPWDGTDESGCLFKTLRLEHKIGKEPVISTLKVSVPVGSCEGEDWLRASSGQNVELLMNIQDERGNGYQSAVAYAGTVYRQNAKIQSYLDRAYPFNGYYTVALAPRVIRRSDGSTAAAGTVPEGNGYLTLTVDAKGGVRFGGKLSDGTAASASAVTAAILRDSSGGSEMVIPVYMSRSPYCFGGEVRLRTQAGSGKPVVSAASDLIWNNDSASATMDCAQGWKMDVAAVGGYYDTVMNLQAHYWQGVFTVSAPTVPGYVTTVQPNGMVVDLYNDALSVDRRVLVKDVIDRRLNDFEKSKNVANVQVRFTRSTGVVSGTFSLWTESVDARGNPVQKEVPGVQHQGVALLSRDATETALGKDVWSAGASLRQVSVIDPATGRPNRVKESLPFNIVDTLTYPDRDSPFWYEIDNWGGR